MILECSFVLCDWRYFFLLRARCVFSSAPWSGELAGALAGDVADEFQSFQLFALVDGVDQFCLVTVHQQIVPCRNEIETNISLNVHAISSIGVPFDFLGLVVSVVSKLRSFSMEEAPSFITALRKFNNSSPSVLSAHRWTEIACR